MRALVVDDSRAIRSIIGKTVKELGFDVLDAGHGREALDRLAEVGRVELILVDWNMPEMNGFEFLVAARATPEWRDTVIIMVTTETEMAQMQRALEAGANEYIMKPFTKDVLREKLQLVGLGRGLSMARIRVLVVDDAVVVRRIVTDVLSGDPDLEVVGTAANGRLALAKVAQLAPDLVTLDLEMPEMDGLETLVELRKTHPRLPVIMFSTLTERGAVCTLEALARGASDYVTKPANVGSVTLAQERIREELIPKIRALCGRLTRRAPVVPPPSPRPVPRPALPVRVDVLAIGVSTGGPNALAEVIPALPAEFPVPIVIVQHMPPVFTRFLADRLTAISRLVVREGEAGEPLTPGAVWVAPGNYHMALCRDGDQIRLALDQEAPENSCRPAVDALFRSVASLYGNRALALMLTGMGQDGLRGSEAIHQAGGQVLAQDEASSVVWGMPGAVVAGGFADLVLPLDRMAGELLQRTAVGRLARLPGAVVPTSLPQH